MLDPDIKAKLDAILAETNQCTNETILPPEPPGIWFSFAKQPPTVEGMYLVFLRHRWDKGAQVCFAWYGKPPATPWLSHPRWPYYQEARCIDNVTHWMILLPPESFDPFTPQITISP